MRSALQTFSLLLMLLFVASCGDIQNEYGSFRPYFVYENHVHQNPRLAEAMTPNSGMFCTVRWQFISGAPVGRVKAFSLTSKSSGVMSLDATTDSLWAMVI